MCVSAKVCVKLLFGLKQLENGDPFVLMALWYRQPKLSHEGLTGSPKGQPPKALHALEQKLPPPLSE